MAYSTDTLAQGAFGKVYKQKYDDTWAAIKKVPQHLIKRKDLERECEVYKKAKHPNIVKLLGKIDLKDGKWIIPLEFIFGEDLETTIFQASKSKIQLSPSIRGTIILGMCEGLLHLHSRDIVHQDLKPDNIMVEHGTNRPVIIDLGLAKFFKFGLNSAADGGNQAYSAPEVLERGTQRDQRSDTWAMGKIIVELCARIRLHTPSVCPAKVKEVMGDQPYCHSVCRMVDPNPSLRASVGGVIQEIRRAASAATDTAGQKGHLKPPQADVTMPPDHGAPAAAPFNRGPSPLNRCLPLFNRDPIPHKYPPLLRREPAPKPQLKALRPQGAMHLPSFPHRAEDKNQQTAPVPAGGSERARDLRRAALFQEATKDLPCNLPKTGRVVIQRVEEKDGEVGRWEQEVVTRDGKIVEINNRFN